MEYLYQFLLFLAQAATILVVVLIILSALASAGARRSDPERGYLRVSDFNERLRDQKDQLQAALLTEDEYKRRSKLEAKQEKRKSKLEQKQKHKSKSSEARQTKEKRVFVLDFDGDVQASRVDQLRKEITAVLTSAGTQDEVVVRLESPGGVVHGYGLAASQLHRVTEQEIPLTVVVDKVAASGGYMMAAVANRIVAAPFAVVGSIGVVAQVPNVHRLLKKNDVDVEVVTAGKYKRTLTMLGENTEEGKAKFQQELDDTHALFQQHITTHRPSVDVAEVATGETWYGQEAVALNLIDEISTSDSYLVKACESASVYEVRWVEQVKPLDKLLGRAAQTAKSLERSFDSFRAQLGQWNRLS